MPCFTCYMSHVMCYLTHVSSDFIYVDASSGLLPGELDGRSDRQRIATYRLNWLSENGLVQAYFFIRKEFIVKKKLKNIYSYFLTRITGKPKLFASLRLIAHS